MSLRHALLGLLAEKPATGYELTKTFEESIGPWAWHTTHSHVYPELRKLSDESLIEVVETKSRGRKTYDVTEEGRAELRRWMLSPPANETVRSESALRVFLINSLEPDVAKEVLQQYADNATRQLEQIREQVEAAGDEWRENPLAVGRLAAERGLRTLPAIVDWARWGISQLDKPSGTTAAPEPPAGR